MRKENVVNKKNLSFPRNGRPAGFGNLLHFADKQGGDPRQKPSGMTQGEHRVMSDCECQRGFTLVELLVVVLIIGILAAVALPQYQRAVVRSRLATLKGIVENITTAAEVYYMENGSYPTSFEQLSISVPTPVSTENIEDTSSVVNYSWGKCTLTISEDHKVYCEYRKNQILYLHRFAYSSSQPGQRGCRGCDAIAQAVCKADTQAETHYMSQGNCKAYQYP